MLSTNGVDVARAESGLVAFAAMPRRRTALLLVLLLATPLYADAPGVYAITGGTVHPVSGPDVPNGVVIIRDGLIEAAGANLTVPPDASVVDATGAHVYPGLIDAQTSLGFATAAPRPRRGGGGGGGAAPPPAPQLPETSPAFEALQNVKLSDEDADARRAIGVTTILTAPSFGIFNGQSVLLNLGSGSLESRVIRNPAALQVSFSPRPSWTFPDSLMGVVAYIRQTLLDGQQYSAAHAIYDRNPAGNPRPETNASLAALAPVLQRNLPVVFVADSDLMFRRAQAIAREFNLRMIVSGARQGYKFASELKAANIPALVSVKWAVPPANKDDRAEQPLRLIRDRQLAPTTPAVLVKSGVTFALVSGPGKTGDFLPGIRKAIDNGLSADDALRAVTLWPARIFGVDRQLGSLDRGKIANVVITDKSIFDKEAKVTRLFVDGRDMRLPRDEAKGGESAASPIDGTWNLSVKTPQGDVSIRATLRNEDGKLSGTFSGDRGSGEIRGGSFDGTTVEFSISVSSGQRSETSDWLFHGTLHDTSLEGTVTTNLGTLQFSGSKPR
jgi:hypothetical protein